MTQTSFRPPQIRRAFTLVEILIVIVIIGILAGIAIPALGIAIRTARQTAIRTEIGALESAIQQYNEKHGDYPPDFSSWAVVQRHYRKIFPRISTNDLELLYNLLHDPGSSAGKADDTFLAAQLDRAEALVWVLGGYSDNIQRPFSGTGGPLSWTGTGSNAYTDSTVTDANRQNPANFQINIERPNALYDFDLARLNYSTINASSPVTGTNRYFSTDDDDLFLTYAAQDDGAPYLYFDSRTYAWFDTPIGDFNGYASTAFGGVRPYISDQSRPNNTGANYADNLAAIEGWQFVNPNTFQILSAGLDSNFGITPVFDVDGDSALEPIYFQYPNGNAMAPRTDRDTPGELLIANVRGYQETEIYGGAEIFQLDNLSNFTNSTMENDIKN